MERRSGKWRIDYWSRMIRIIAWILLGLVLGLPLSARSGWIEVSADVSTRLTRPLYDFSKGVSYFDASLVNQSADMYTQPMRLVVEQLLPATIGVRNADGVTAQGWPYYDMSPYLGDGHLSAGEVSAARRIELNNPSRQRFTIDLRVWVEEAVQHPPVANAGPDQTVPVGSVVVLDGSGSSDPDGDSLSYSWDLPVRPPGSLATLDDPTAVDPSFVVDRPGSYTAELIVDDGTSASAPDQVVIDTSNSPPVADAGPDQTLPLGAEVQLYGSGSSDVDGQALSYHWTLAAPSGSAALMDDPSSVTPRFTIDLPGNYVATLIVNDGQVESAPDSVSITTENTRPVADAGPDQSVPLGASVSLDGSGSSDADGDALSYLWSLSTPPGSSARLSDATDVAPTFDVDLSGSYVGQLIVNDGLADSAPDSVTVSTLNSRPVACIQGDFLVFMGNALVLDGSCSSDADADPLSFQWSLTSSPEGSSPQLSSTDTDTATLIPDLLGLYVVQLIVYDGELASAPVTATVTAELPSPLNRDPQINSTPPAEATIGQPYVYDVNATDPDGDTLSYSLTQAPAGMTIDLPTGVIAWIPTAAALAASPVAVTVQVKDGRGGFADQEFSITVNSATTQVQVPDLIGLTRAEAIEQVPAAKLSLRTFIYVHDSTIQEGRVMAQAPAAGTLADLGDAVDLTVSLGADEGLPPDPETVAPLLDQTVATTLVDSTKFLYTGDIPIQTGVALGVIDARHVSVIRGRILNQNGQPLPGISVSALNHPEFGQTLSRADGEYDFAVNGGGYLTIDYRRDGYLPAQRQVIAPWQEYVRVEDVALIQRDTEVTVVDLTSSQLIQLVRGSPVSDKDGTRQATLLIPNGTTAMVYKADGSTSPVTTLTLSATEYTVGDNGPERMPAPLPPASAYTYAVELSAVEADRKIEGKDVLFNQVVPFYLDNFLNIPVGTPVPSGYLDRDRATWLASDDGRVIKILSIADGLASLDTDGDGAADEGAALGVSESERRALAGLYEPGKTLWRVPLEHLSTYDFNYGAAPPAGASPCGDNCQPISKKESCQKVLDCEECSTIKEGRSVLDCESQTLREDIPIAGSPFKLTYASDRVPGRTDLNSLSLTVSGTTLPPGLKNIQVEVNVAGRTFYQELQPLPMLKYTFHWDGKDVYGRKVNGTQQARIRVAYDYGYVAAYARPGGAGSRQIFGAYADTPLAGTIGRVRYLLWSPYFSQPIGNWDGATLGVAGWSLTPHHAYDPVGKTLYRGDGTRLSADSLPDVMQRIAGQWNQAGYSGDEGPASEALLSYPRLLTVGPDGSLYVSDQVHTRIRRIDPSGIITTVAGNGSRGCPVSGVSALASPLYYMNAAAAPDGTLYLNSLSCLYNGIAYPVYHIERDGTLRKLDNQSNLVSAPYSEDDLAIGPDGSLYHGANPGFLARADVSGALSMVTPVGVYMQDLAVDEQGNVIFETGGSANSGYVIWRADTSGKTAPVAGNGSDAGLCTPSGDGQPADSVRLCRPSNVSIGNNSGSIYFVENPLTYQSRPLIRRVSDGFINTVAGCVGGPNCFWADESEEGRPAKSVALGTSSSGTVSAVWGADGLYYADSFGQVIYRIAKPVPGVGTDDLVVGDDGGNTIHVFDRYGRHLRTLNAATGAVLYRFGYDTEGRLIRIEDSAGNITSIERDGMGQPASIVAPYGQRTTLTVHADSYLTTVTDPAGQSHALSYQPGGLLTGFRKPNNQTTHIAYAADGRLNGETDAANSTWTLNETSNFAGDQRTVTLTDSEGRITRYRTENLANNDIRRTVVWPDGTQTTSLHKTDGAADQVRPDGTTLSLIGGPDPRFGMQTPVLSSHVYKTGNLTRTLAASRNLSLANPSDLTSLVAQTDTFTTNGRSSTRTYDAATRTNTQVSAAGRKTVTTSDAVGRPTRTLTTGIEPLTFSYDGHGRLAGVTQGSGADERSVVLTYDPEGNLASVTDPLLRTVSFTYDAVGNITKQVFPDGRQVDFDYDANGNLTSLTPPGRPEHAFSYTTVDLTAEYIPPDVGAGTNSTSYSYNSERQLTGVARPDGLTLDFAYDSAGRLKTLTTPDGATAYSYDNATGKLVSIDTPAGNGLVYAFNGALPTSTNWTGAIAGKVGFVYDNDFRVKEIQLNDADPVVYQYDADSLLIQAGALSLSRSTDNGLLTGSSLGNLNDSLSYNGFGEPSQYAATYNGSDLLKFIYTRDKLGRITHKKEIRGSLETDYDYAYDIADRLAEVKKNNLLQASYSYDANGNRLQYQGSSTVNATYDDQDRLLTYGNASYQYTANGELKTKTVGTSVTQYQYDVLGNLKQVKLPAGRQIDYVVDGQNRRIGKQVDGVLTQAFLWQDQLKPLAELDGSGNLVSRFVYGTHVNVPDYLIKAGETYRLITDHLGSPRLVVRVSDGVVMQRMEYDEFGRVLEDTNPGFQPFGFAGGLYDRDTGLVRFGARDYDGLTGRWLSKDPILFGGEDPNLYVYGGSSPTTNSDPQGTRFRSVVEILKGYINHIYLSEKFRKDNKRGGHKSAREDPPTPYVPTQDSRNQEHIDSLTNIEERRRNYIPSQLQTDKFRYKCPIAASPQTGSSE